MEELLGPLWFHMLGTQVWRQPVLLCLAGDVNRKKEAELSG